MQSNFSRNSLKTKKSGTDKVTHFSCSRPNPGQHRGPVAETRRPRPADTTQASLTLAAAGDYSCRSREQSNALARNQWIRDFSMI
jgi:hypothetical protein